jgi:hypothetical protein
MVDVLRPNEVYYDGKYYPVQGIVRTSLSSQYPRKVVFGDVDKDSNPRTSIIVWDDWTEGVGLYSTDGKEGLKRSSFSRADGRYKNHLTLPPLFTTLAAHSVSGVPPIGLVELVNNIYVGLNLGKDVRAYTPSSDSWGSNVVTLSQSAIDTIAFTLGGTDYIAFAYTAGYQYSSNGSSWTDDTTDVKSFAYWDDRLWGIDNAGQLWFSVTIGTEVNDAKLPLPDGYAHVLFVGPDATGKDILYVATDVGLWAHDAANSRFVRTGVRFPRQTAEDSAGQAAQGAVTWNGEIYITAGGMSVYRYDPVRGTVFPIGLDRDSGMAESKFRGDIYELIATHVGVLACVDGSTSSDGLVWEYNGRGWHYYTRTEAVISSQHVSGIGSNYRFYHSVGSNIGYTDLQKDRINPDAITVNYDGTNDIAYHETPWFNAGQNDIDKTAIRTRIDCTGMGSTETVKVEFALDYSSSYEASSFTVNSDGVTVKTFPTIANKVRETGSDFRAIRFKLTFNRGSTATNTPNVRSLSLEWRRKLVARYGFTLDINRTRPSRDKRDPGQMKADIITAIEKGTQVEFTFVDEAGVTQNYFVDTVDMKDVQQTGSKEYGLTQLVLAES